jgi:DNA-binding transcriptional LysR family regulator
MIDNCYDTRPTSVFKEISKEGTFRAAAHTLHLSQPALSTSLKRLEENLGFALYDRSGYRPQLTEQGRRFLKGLDVFLESYTQLQELSDELRGSCETFSESRPRFGMSL